MQGKHLFLRIALCDKRSKIKANIFYQQKHVKKLTFSERVGKSNFYSELTILFLVGKKRREIELRWVNAGIKSIIIQ